MNPDGTVATTDNSQNTSAPAPTYVVAPGDTLSGIAAANNIPLAQVESFNPQIQDPNLIFPGQTVNLSSDGSAASSAPSGGPATQVVAPGDTLSGIAAANNIPLAQVESLNPQIKNPSLIHPGEVINLNASAPSAGTGGTVTTGASSGPSQLDANGNPVAADTNGGTVTTTTDAYGNLVNASGDLVDDNGNVIAAATGGPITVDPSGNLIDNKGNQVDASGNVVPAASGGTPTPNPTPTPAPTPVGASPAPAPTTGSTPPSSVPTAGSAAPPAATPTDTTSPSPDTLTFTTDAYGNLVNASGDLVDDNGNVIAAATGGPITVDPSGNLIDNKGNQVDASGNVVPAASGGTPTPNPTPTPAPTPVGASPAPAGSTGVYYKDAAPKLITIPRKPHINKGIGPTSSSYPVTGLGIKHGGALIPQKHLNKPGGWAGPMPPPPEKGAITVDTHKNTNPLHIHVKK